MLPEYRNLPLNYALPKSFESQLDFAEESYLIDKLTPDGSNLQFQNQGNRWGISLEIVIDGDIKETYAECETRLGALRKLHKEIYGLS